MIRSIKNPFFPIYFVLFLDNFGFSMMFAIFGPLFNEPDYGMVTAQTSAAMRSFLLAVAYMVFSIGQFVGAPFLGDIADEYGRKKAFYITITATACGYILTGLCLFAHSATLLIFSRLLTGFFAGNLSICLASITDLAGDEKSRSKHFSMIVVITGVSWMLAMLIGGYLSNPATFKGFNPALPFFITAGLSFLSLLAIRYWFNESHVTGQKFRFRPLVGFQNIMAVFKIQNLRVLYLVYLIWIAGWGLSFQWFSPYSLQRFHVSIEAVTWAQFLAGLAWIIGGYYLNNYLLKRFSIHPMVVAGTGLVVLGLIGASSATNYLLFATIWCLTTIPGAFAWPNTLNLISLNAPEDIQGKIMGISQSSMSIGFIFATILGGLFSGNKGLYFLYPTAAIAMLISWLLLVYQSKRPA